MTTTDECYPRSLIFPVLQWQAGGSPAWITILIIPPPSPYSHHDDSENDTQYTKKKLIYCKSYYFDILYYDILCYDIMIIVISHHRRLIRAGKRFPLLKDGLPVGGKGVPHSAMVGYR